MVLLSDLDVVDFVLVEDHQGEGLVFQLPGAVPHQVGPVLNTETETDMKGKTRETTCVQVIKLPVSPRGH